MYAPQETRVLTSFVETTTCHFPERSQVQKPLRKHICFLGLMVVDEKRSSHKTSFLDGKPKQSLRSKAASSIMVV